MLRDSTVHRQGDYDTEPGHLPQHSLPRCNRILFDSHLKASIWFRCESRKAACPCLHSLTYLRSALTKKSLHNLLFFPFLSCPPALRLIDPAAALTHHCIFSRTLARRPTFSTRAEFTRPLICCSSDSTLYQRERFTPTAHTRDAAARRRELPIMIPGKGKGKVAEIDHDEGDLRYRGHSEWQQRTQYQRSPNHVAGAGVRDTSPTPDPLHSSGRHEATRCRSSRHCSVYSDSEPPSDQGLSQIPICECNRSASSRGKS